jgi:hypothetical protein
MTAKAWLERQLSDGRKHSAERLVIGGMMAGYAERTLRRAAQVLHVTFSYAQAQGVLPGGSVEYWQLPTSQG